MSTELSTIEGPGVTALVRPVATPAALIEAHKAVSELIEKALEKGKDFGVIPGTGDKPTLLKPGAERLCIAFGSYPEYEVVSQEIDHDRPVAWSKRKKVWRNAHRGDREFTWQQESGESTGVYRYVVRCQIVSRGNAAILGVGIGACSTMESKYVDRPRECENTALKMAQKRALVAATLNAFGLSDRFTQDVEDLPRDHVEPPVASPPAAAPKDDPTVIPFGKDRGKKLAECSADHIVRMKEWAEQNNPKRFAGFIAACEAAIARHEDRNESSATGASGAPVPAGSFEEMPEALKEAEDDLPF